jgi:hypothetical protein
MTQYYRATFKKQGTGSLLGWKNCGAASGAMLVDQFTLGAVSPTPDAFRKRTGDFSGGLMVAQIGNAAESYGARVTVYDASDGYTYERLVADLQVGKFAVATGDYDVVPNYLAGDKTFAGLHSEFWHVPTTGGIVVGDPLNDGRRVGIPKGYVTYPFNVAREYVNKLDRQVPGNGIHAVVMDRQRVRARTGITANVRLGPSTASTVVGRIRGTTALVWGTTVLGSSVAGNRLWYRLWWPTTSRIAFVHSSVATRI